jgi:ubiquitin carboxyl-terminal hydrolase 22/27/51
MVSSKIETQVMFPSELDLVPYLSSSVIGKAPKKRANTLSHLYDLFAVVNHHGNLDNGHYTCYVQQQMGNGSFNEWVKCDDAVLTRVSASEVHESQCYILFYCKRFLEYY